MALLLLGGCKKEAAESSQSQAEDPVRASALQGPVMTDPDLAYRNVAGQALTAGGPPVIELPAIEVSPEAIAAAKAEAEKLVQRSANPLGAPQEGIDPAVRDAITASQMVRGMKGVSPDCAGKMTYDLSWSLRLPAPFSIYPRGHLQDAAGVDYAGCRLRVVSYLSPVNASDIATFYHARLSAGQTSSQYRADGDGAAVQALEGESAGIAYRVRLRQFKTGLTAVDLVTSGG